MKSEAVQAGIRSTGAKPKAFSPRSILIWAFAVRVLHRKTAAWEEVQVKFRHVAQEELPRRRMQHGPQCMQSCHEPRDATSATEYVGLLWLSSMTRRPSNYSICVLCCCLASELCACLGMSSSGSFRDN